MASEATPSKKDKPEEDIGSLRLEDLEQHISTRMSRLTPGVESGTPVAFPPLPRDADPAPPTAHFIPVLEPPESGAERFIPPFEGFEYPTERASGVDYRAASHSFETKELLESIEDLTDLVTNSVRQLAIRMNALEEKLEPLSVASPQELDKTLREIRDLLRAHIKQSQAALPSASGGQQAAQGSEAASAIIPELQKQVELLESYIERSSGEVKQKVEDHRSALREYLDARFKVLEKLDKDSRDVWNRHLFNLAVLLIIVLFIAGALVTNTIDRMASYLTQSLDSLRASVDEITLPRPGGR